MVGKPDPKGPDHSSTVTPLAIAGASVEAFPAVPYQHGVLTEVINPLWDGMFRDPIEHGYIIDNGPHQPRDEWYMHEKQTDRYVCIAGELEVALFDARDDSPTRDSLVLFTLYPVGSEGPSGVKIPPGVWHSLITLENRVVVFNFKMPAYDPHHPDKLRIPMPHERVDFSWSTHRPASRP